MLLYIAIVLFLAAASFGLIVLTAILKDRPTPKPVVFLHGLFAATALSIVLYYVIQFDAPGITALKVSATLFVLAALGGLTLFTMDMQKKPLPKVIALIHPLVAISGLIALVIFVMK